MKNKTPSYFNRLGKDLKKYAGAYVLVLPVLLYYFLFDYKPLYGIIIAFKDYSPGLGIWKSPWLSDFGMRNFIDFFNSYYFGRLIKNTLVISISTLVVGFPAPIIFALLLNEVRNLKFKRLVQTVSYMPHFISLVVTCGMIRMFVSHTGIITYIMSLFGAERVSLLSRPEYFVPIYVISGVWANIGWNAIIYISALASVDQELYEAAKIDGANRWKQTIHVTLPGIANTIIILLIMRVGGLMSVGYEKIILLYNDGILETADVISSFVYRKGLVEAEYSYSAAIGLFNSLINFILVVVVNKISKKFSEVSIW